MAYRITEKQLEAVCDLINREMKRPMEPWSKSSNGYKANIGNFHISYAYGGVSLHEMCSDGGGVNDVFNQGHCPKRELFTRMHALLDGIQLQKENAA